MPDYPSPPPPLFAHRDEPSAPYVPHSATSRAAAESVTPHLGEMQQRVLDAIAARGGVGCTDNEGIALRVVHANGWRARRVELAKRGLIVPNGERNGSTVWIATTTPKE